MNTYIKTYILEPAREWLLLNLGHCVIRVVCNEIVQFFESRYFPTSFFFRFFHSVARTQVWVSLPPALIHAKVV